jgi:Flp pilus assembly protein TadD
MPNALERTRVPADGAQRGPDALYSAGVALWREGRRAEAIKLMDGALRLKPDFADALCMGGYMLSECGQPQSAMRFYRRALELDASLVVGHVNFGKLLFGAGRFAEALASFAAATALAPDDPDAWCSRAGALRSWGALRNRLRRLSVRLSCALIFPRPRLISAMRC